MALRLFSSIVYDLHYADEFLEWPRTHLVKSSALIPNFALIPAHSQTSNDFVAKSLRQHIVRPTSYIFGGYSSTVVIPQPMLPRDRQLCSHGARARASGGARGRPLTGPLQDAAMPWRIAPAAPSPPVGRPVCANGGARSWILRKAGGRARGGRPVPFATRTASSPCYGSNARHTSRPALY